MDEVLGKLIEFLQSASPLVWQTLMKQVYLSALGSAFFALVCLASAVVLFVKSSLYKKDSESVFTDADWDNPFTLFVYLRIFSIFSALITLFIAYQSVMRFINPEYYAIELILAKIGGG